ncbi:MAG: ROK family protein [Maritimibacter sp.]
MSTSTQVIGLDLGGTKLWGGTRGIDGKPGGELNWPTETISANALIGQIVDMITELREGSDLAQVVLGVPAVPDPKTGRLSLSPNVPLASVDDLAGLLSARIGVPVAIENDANLAAFAEAREGAGMGHDLVTMVSLGTGIGMGTVIGGRMLRGARGQAGELGSAILDSGEMLEDQVGTPGILARDPKGAASVKEIFARADAGEETALGLLDETARITARALSFVLSSLDPDLLVIGGGIGTQPRFYALMETHLNKAVPMPFSIAPAKLGPRAGLQGAMLFSAEIGSDLPH